MEAEAKAKADAEKEVADAKKRAKQEEKARLIKEGKWLTKKQLAQKKQAEANLAKFRQAGLIVGDEEKGKDEAPRGTAVVRNRKKDKKNKAQESAANESAAAASGAHDETADSTTDLETTTTTVEGKGSSK